MLCLLTVLTCIALRDLYLFYSRIKAHALYVIDTLE